MAASLFTTLSPLKMTQGGNKIIRCQMYQSRKNRNTVYFALTFTLFHHFYLLATKEYEVSLCVNVDDFVPDGVFLGHGWLRTVWFGRRSEQKLLRCVRSTVGKWSAFNICHMSEERFITPKSVLSRPRGKQSGPKTLKLFFETNL